ncbi:chymotrypsin inhibitor-like [Culex pipiens pallens]|uniref:chymotrypsin inhibitor-like n=1 Tax=Culex pipiens pallens TaxID=42434 RepID=UPI001954E891|nr:chymotrypsin inhibitor-like [Culex pipiens pallens]
MRSFILVLILASFLALATSNPLEPVPCQHHEMFLQCGTACPDTCETIRSTEPRICPAICISGCFCQEDYVRNAENQCILRAECDSLG